MLGTLNGMLLLVFGGLIGAVVFWFLFRQRRNQTILSNQHQFAIEKAELTNNLSNAHSNLEVLTTEINLAKTTSINLQNTVTNLRTEYAGLEAQAKLLPELKKQLEYTQSLLSTEQKQSTELRTRLEEKTRSAEEQLLFIKEAKASLATEFQNVGQKIFEEKSEKFTQQNKRNLEGLLNPFREKISTFKKKVDDVYDKETKDRVALSQQVNQLNSFAFGNLLYGHHSP